LVKAKSSRKRKDLGLHGIAPPAHVGAQFGPLDSGVRFDPEQPRFGAAAVAIGANKYFALF
jgi:hypothetical protein